MADPFVAEIRIVGFNFPPRGWAFCNGQLLPLSQNTALFSLIGTIYGGNGQSNFALPDFQGRAAIHWGQGNGLSPRQLGETGGADAVTLTTSEMPAHTHQMSAATTPASTTTPSGATSLTRSARGTAYDAAPLGTATTMAPEALTVAGASTPHNNLMPYTTVNYIIALQGIYPPRG